MHASTNDIYVEQALLLSPIPQLVVLAMMVQSSRSDASALQISCEGALPFACESLENALRYRRRLLVHPTRPVQVSGLPDGNVSISVGEGRRDVDLQNHVGETAARIVALLVLDLLAESPPVRETSRPPSSPAERPTTVSAQALLASVGDGWPPAVEPALDISRRIHPHIEVWLGAGYRSWSAGDGATELHVRAFPVRAGLGVGGRRYALRAAGLLRADWVDGAGTDRILYWGATASVALFQRLATHWSIMATGGIDIVHTRTEFRVAGQPVLSSGWYVPWVGLGLAWSTSP